MCDTTGSMAVQVNATPAGGLSFVIPNWQGNGTDGILAFKGKEKLGYEAVLTRAERLTRVMGCNFQKSPNAGLSGTFYDPNRDGEGLIAQ